MKKYVVSIIFTALMLCLCGNYANATEQYPDYIIINGEKYELYVDWSFPSPLETYFSITKQRTPFRSWSTANYRGHIATWEIRDSTLYLTQIDTRRQHNRTGTYFPNSQKRIDTLASPTYFGIKSLNSYANSSNDIVLADWFTGTIVANRFIDRKDREIYYDKKSSKREKRQAQKRIKKQQKYNDKAGDIYLYVRNGKVVAMYTINQKDLERARSISEKDTSDHEFIRKYQMLYLNQNYIQYHLSQGLTKDSIIWAGHSGIIPKGDKDYSLVMGYFDDDVINWPFNWENFRLCGAPKTQLEIIHDSVFITGIKVAQTGGMFEQTTVDVPLDSIFPSEFITDGKLFAVWLNGKYVIDYTVVDDYDYIFTSSKSYIDKIQRLEIKDGIVQHSQFYPTTFTQDSVNGLDRAHHFCNPELVCCTKFGIWLPVDIKKLPKVTENAEYLGSRNAMLDFLKQHPLSDTTINGRFMIGFGLNCKGQADHFWMTDLRNDRVIDWGETILDAIRQLPQQWQPAKYAPKEGDESQPVDSYQVIDVTIQNGQFIKAFLNN